jgi:hypothetical protein
MQSRLRPCTLTPLYERYMTRILGKVNQSSLVILLLLFFELPLGM